MNDEIDDGIAENDIELPTNDEDPTGEIRIEEEIGEEDPPFLEDHANEAGRPATRTSSASATVGGKHFWRLEDSARMRSEQQFLADLQIGEVYTQFTLQKGLKIYGKRAEKSVVKAFQELQKQDVLHSTPIKQLTPDKMRRTLRLIMVV